MPRLLVVLAAVAALLPAAAAHEHHGEAPTCSSGGGRVLAEFRPGEVTVDGHSDDWDSVEASEFALLPALDPDEDKVYSGGKVAIKVRLFQALFVWVWKISSPVAHRETCGSREVRLNAVGFRTDCVVEIEKVIKELNHGLRSYAVAF